MVPTWDAWLLYRKSRVPSASSVGRLFELTSPEAYFDVKSTTYKGGWHHFLGYRLFVLGLDPSDQLETETTLTLSMVLH